MTKEPVFIKGIPLITREGHARTSGWLLVNVGQLGWCSVPSICEFEAVGWIKLALISAKSSKASPVALFLTIWDERRALASNSAQVKWFLMAPNLEKMEGRDHLSLFFLRQHVTRRSMWSYGPIRHNQFQSRACDVLTFVASLPNKQIHLMWYQKLACI